MTDIDLRLPCHEGDPEDWFLSRDGKQYGDDELLTSQERQLVIAAVANDRTDDAAYVEAVDRAIDRAEADARTTALGRRRRAKDACYSCLLRTRCLDKALREGHESGTWGGYYEEELRELRREIRRRNNKRRDMTPAAEE